jgi:glycosyltransferase involved in cell wall biosynthesis
VRLLHLHSGNIYGGIETMLVTIARERERAGGAEVEFALCFPGRLHDELSAAGFAPEQLGEVRLRQPNSLRRVRQRLRTLLKDRRPDAVVVHGPWAQAVFGAEVRRAGVPLVLWLHGRSHGIIHRLAVQTPPDAIICNSAATADTLAPAYDHLPRVVVHCPVSRPPAPDAALRADVRASLDTAADAVVVVQAGRLEAWKGHEVHLRALGRLSDVPSWALWIAGGAGSPAEAAYVRRLQALASDAGIGDRVRFLGERRDVARLLAGTVRPGVHRGPLRRASRCRERRGRAARDRHGGLRGARPSRRRGGAGGGPAPAHGERRQAA